MNQQSIPSLAHYLSAEIVRPLVVKSWRGHQIQLGRFIMGVSFCYETTALVGRARKDHLRTIASMFSTAGTEQSTAEGLKNLARDRLAHFKKLSDGLSPTSFCDLIAVTEIEKRSPGVILGKSGIPATKKALEASYDFQMVEPYLKVVVYEGFAFGCAFADLTESMCRSTYEGTDAVDWATWKNLGLQLGEAPNGITYHQREQEALVQVASYVNSYYSQLLGPLRLDFSS